MLFIVRSNAICTHINRCNHQKTDSRFLSCVDPLVDLHVNFLHEGLAAKLARELLILEMNLFVAFSEMALSVKLVKQRRVFRIRTAKIG